MPTLRAETTKVVQLASLDLTRLWRLVAEGANAGEALHDLLPAIVREYGSLGGAVAAEWYDQQRVKADVGGQYFAEPIPVDDRGTHALVGSAIKEATTDVALQSLILGGVQRRVADHLRLTVTNNSVFDRGAKGWIRVGSGGTCKWCNQYIDGEIRTVAGYDFDAHDNCNCTTQVAWL